MTPVQQAAVDRMYIRMVEIMTDEPDLSMDDCLHLAAALELLLHGVPDAPRPVGIIGFAQKDEASS